MSGLGDVAARLGALYADLPPKLRRAAKFAIDAPTEVALGSLREVAKRSGVGPTTLIRLAQQIGFATYDEFRDAFRDQVRQDGGAYARRAAELQGESARHAGSVTEDVVASAQANLVAASRMLEPAVVQAAAQALLKARRVYVLGMRSAHAAAFYGHYLGKLIRSDMRLIEGRASMLVDEIGDCGPKDALIAISFAPYPRETVAACRLFVERGGTLLAITDSALSPVAQGARHVFLTPTASPSFYISFMPTLVVLEALFATMAAAGGPEMVTFLRRNEAMRDGFGVYWRDGG